jgi:hypothetical protein
MQLKILLLNLGPDLNTFRAKNLIKTQTYMKLVPKEQTIPIKESLIWQTP